MTIKQQHLLDHFVSIFDASLRTLIKPAHRHCTRINPAKNIAETSLTIEEKNHIAALMRVNHAGEVAAQALYQGQALTAQLTTTKTQMAQAAADEINHLAWCEERLEELNNKPSLLNPLWFIGSLLIGALAGFAGDRWSLGFVAETEHQVSQHLQKHLHRLPKNDLKTKAILTQMEEDEASHAAMAYKAGAMKLPFPLKHMMQRLSKLMTMTSYYI